MMQSGWNRRGFLTAMLASVLPLRGASIAEADVALFTKHFLGYSHEQLADAVLATGMKALDLPLRKQGQIEPERVEDDLPVLMQQLQQRGLSLPLITSGINAVSKDQFTERVLRAAKAAGVTHYRMNYFRYDLQLPLQPQIADWQAKIKDLVQLSSEIGITPIYQNHSGANYFGAPLWDLYQVAQDYDGNQFGVAFDLMHAVIEGGKSWPLQWQLMREHAPVFYVKNCMRDQQGFKPCGLAEGVVTEKMLQTIMQSRKFARVSLHIEHLPHRPKEADYLAQAIAETRKDYATFLQWRPS